MDSGSEIGRTPVCVLALCTSCSVSPGAYEPGVAGVEIDGESIIVGVEVKPPVGAPAVVTLSVNSIPFRIRRNRIAEESKIQVLEHESRTTTVPGVAPVALRDEVVDGWSARDRMLVAGVASWRSCGSEIIPSSTCVSTGIRYRPFVGLADVSTGSPRNCVVGDPRGCQRFLWVLVWRAGHDFIECSSGEESVPLMWRRSGDGCRGRIKRLGS